MLGTLAARRRFSPTRLANLALWLDAANSASITLNGSTVSAWADMSGNDRTLSQSVANNQPTYSTGSQNGRNTLSFNGSTNFLRGPWPLTLTAQSVFAVVSMTSTNNWGRPFTQTTTGDATATGTMNADFAITGHYIPLLRNSNTQAFGSYNGGGLRASVNFTYSTWGVWSSIHTGSQISSRLDNGTASTYSTATFNTTFHSCMVGANMGPAVNQFLGGNIGEILVYSRAVTDAERNAISAYLKAKWATP